MSADLIAEAITEYWGERCPDFAKDCPTCKAWAEYDRLRFDTLKQAAALMDETTQSLRLHCGELSAQEIRAVKAVLSWKKAAIMGLIETPKTAPSATRTNGA